MISLRRLLKKLHGEQGFTLIEMLVTMGLFGILTTVLFSVVMNGASNLNGIRQSADLNEESRLVLNRMSRELREARVILAVREPDGAACHTQTTPPNPPNPAYPCQAVGIIFDVDLNGDNSIDLSTGDSAERLSYQYDGANKRLLLVTGCSSFPCATGVEYPILAANVERFVLTYTSQKYQCDKNLDGKVTWLEIDDRVVGDTCPDALGNDNDQLDQLELESINSVAIELTVLTGNREQKYRTQLDLRNRPL